MNETAADAAGSRGPSKANPVPADEFKKLLIQCFPADAKVHSFYSCQADKCVTLSKEDQQRMKGKDRFQHQWISDNSLSYCEKTGYHWLLFQEGKGMFCIICRKHDTINPQNKSKKFNTEPSVRFKRKTVEEHASHQQHLAAVEAELLSRVSVFQHQVSYREQVRESVYYNAFLSLYWVAKEELANCKFVRLLLLVEDLGVTDLKLFQHRSSGSVREMFLLLGKVIKEHVCKRARLSNCFGLLCDEVCDISCKEQLVTFLKFVDPDTGKATTEFLAIDDVLQHSTSANAEAIKTVLIRQLNESQVELKKLTSLSSDGASVMTGKRNGVAVLLREESKVMLNVHCICHRLALACGDANDEVSYIKTVEKILVQLWSFFKNSAKKTAAYAKAVKESKAITLSEEGNKKMAKKFSKACRTRWLFTEKAIQGVFEDFTPLTQTLRVFKEEGDAPATGLLQQVAHIKFLGAVYILHHVLPALSHLSRAFQGGNVSFAAIEPAVKFTIDEIQDVADQQKPLKQLQKDLGDRLAESEMTLSDDAERKLVNLTNRYVSSLVENINSRFSNSLPVLTAFRIFDPLGVPEKSDESFKLYGTADIKILAGHFYQCEENKEELEEELLCEWKKFKYNLLQLKSDIPLHVLKPPQKKNLTSPTPTEWLLQHLLSMRHSYQAFFPHLLEIAEICLSLPVSNAWPERGASAVKRLKSRLRSSLNNDMLASLMHMSINGPELRTSQCDNLIAETVKTWLAQPRRKIARGKEGNAVKRVDVAVQAEIGENDTVTQPDMDLSQTEPDQTFSTQDETNELHNVELEVAAAVSIMKLPEDSDSESGDSDFEYD